MLLLVWFKYRKFKSHFPSYSGNQASVFDMFQRESGREDKSERLEVLGLEPTGLDLEG